MSALTLLRVTLELDGPWLVGDPTRLGDVNTTPLREYDGTPQIPTTSLAGSLRDHLRGKPGIDVAAWMGEVRRGEQEHPGTPSRLRVLGVRLIGGERSAIRATTAIDAHTGSARRKMLRREEYVDAKTVLAVYLLHTGAPESPMLEALASWRPVIGRRRTSGWGRSTLTEVKHATVDLRQPDQLVAWLNGGGPEQIDQLLSEATALPPPSATEEQDLIRARFAVPSGLHVGTGELSEAEVGDEEGQVRRIADVIRRDGKPYVPASSWRGVLRGHAAFVLRSLGLPSEDTEDAVNRVFGSQLQRGRLTFHDAVVEGSEDTGAAPETDHEHVGIDRITGGARSNLLFTDRAATGTVELRISVDDPSTVPGWARSLLGHAVRDLADGFLAIGGRTTRGLGTLRLVEWPDAVLPSAEPIDISELAAEVR